LASAVKNTPANGDDLSVGGVTAARAIPVAVEIAVTATGAKPTQGKGQRELFTEQTSTVLVLPDGAVIRLAAAVTQSQLIFLTNNTTKCEVVCQVLRKRSYRPTSCYVELQFTEATPDFWGVDFLTEEAVSAGSQAGEEVAAAEAVVEGPAAGVAAPSDKEVLHLRQEVEALRTQLQSLMVKKDENAAAPAAAEVAGAEAGTGSGEGSLEHLLPQVELDFSKVPANAGTGLAGANRKPALVDTGILRVGGLVLVLAGVLAGAWYENWLPLLKRSAGPVGAATAGNVIAKPAKASGGSATPASTSANGNAKSGIPVGAAGAQPTASEVKSGATTVASADAAKPSTGTAAKAEDSEDSSAAARKNSGARDVAGKNSKKHGAEKAAAQPTDAAPDAGADSAAISPAKLLHPVNPVYPPDAMRNYITGDVRLDAVVEADGRVGTMNVLSGPAPLRAAAMEALKQYKYAPATQNGKGAASHVTVTIKFWFDP
jgi:TonB family protein